MASTDDKEAMPPSSKFDVNPVKDGKILCRQDHMREECPRSCAMMNRSNLIILLLFSGIVLQAAPVVEPPPEPAKLSKKERSSLVAIYESLVSETTPLGVGSSEAEVLERMGPPEGVMTVGDRKRMAYGSGHIIVAEGKVVAIEDVPADWLASPNRQAYDDYQRALGKVYYRGKWMSSEESWQLYERTKTARERTGQRITRGRIESAKRQQQHARKQAPILDYRQNGARITRQELVVPGKVTVVDFYADWCGPCKQIAPYLVNLATDPEVAVRKVDIVSWRSPVAQQWKLSSIPNMRVFDRQGQPVGKPTHDLREVMRLIDQAKAN